MGRIRQLPPDIANKIAAGEVIERPASVVKELVENAIDAGATRIAIELADAGRELIRVSDDGCGMEPDDLVLCFAQHATSKIESSDDLFAISTMGFRGEALASVASISRARAVSRTPDAAQAHEIVCEGGELSEPRPASGAPGTVIEVANLFYNTPVRRKFLRQNSTEVGRVIDVVQRIALAFPSIGFSLRHDGKALFDFPPGQRRRDRIVAFSGHEIDADLLEINDFDEYAALTGFVGGVGRHRPNSRDLNLFVNNRFIRDRSLLQAVVLAFREFIPHGRYPMAWLFLDIDPTEVDVNVHPTKIEVRFMQANRLFSKIKAAVQETVLRSGQLPRLDLTDRRLEQVKALASLPQARIHEALGKMVAERTAPLVQARPGDVHEPDLELATPGYDEHENALFPAANHARIPAADPTLLPREMLDNARLLNAKMMPPSPTNRLSNEAAVAPAPGFSGMPQTVGETRAAASDLLTGARGVFQIGNAYIIVETGDGMVLIDQHAYHERILYWRLEHRMASAQPEMQRLLVPEPLQLSRAASEVLAENREAFREFGFDIEPFGAGGWACFAVPRYARLRNAGEFIAGSLDELAASGRTRNPQELRKAMVEMTACRAAVKAGDELTADDIAALLAEGAKVPHTFACPHGRPTTYKLTFTDLEKIFHRR